MTKIAERVHHDQFEIAMIESRIADLDDAAIVEITMADGTHWKGTVTARPTVQTFRDAEGNEGVNALLRLDDLASPGKSHYLWLDQITDIRHLGTA
ncbi:MAG: DUF3247 family protein [Pseudoxanthomonas sp.]